MWYVVIRKRGTTEYLKPEELLKVIAEAKKRGTREHAMFLLAYAHALRASEIAMLTVDDVRSGKISCKPVSCCIAVLRLGVVGEGVGDGAVYRGIKFFVFHRLGASVQADVITSEYRFLGSWFTIRVIDSEAGR